MFTKLGELGMMGVVWPTEYGGAGLSTLDYAIVMEELSRVDAGVALSLAAHNSLVLGPHLPGRQRGAEEEVPGAARHGREGRLLGPHREPARARDAGGTKTTAVKDGNDWVLNGSKNFITNAASPTPPW